MKSWLYVGAKIVCVDDDANSFETAGRWNPEDLRAGEIYTADWVGEVDHPRFGRYLGVTVVGVVRTDWSMANVPFDASRFRPLHDCSATIAALRQAMRDHVAKNGAGIKRGVRV